MFHFWTLKIEVCPNVLGGKLGTCQKDELQVFFYTFCISSNASCVGPNHFHLEGVASLIK